MDEKEYKLGQNVIYSEDNGRWAAEVVENNCTPNQIAYSLKIIREISPPRFDSLKPGQIIIYHRSKTFSLGDHIELLVSEEDFR